jgi:hypothetical protein
VPPHIQHRVLQVPGCSGCLLLTRHALS